MAMFSPSKNLSQSTSSTPEVTSSGLNARAKGES
jgi:hypothetical protein